MRKIKGTFSLSIGFNNADRFEDFEIEVEDDAEEGYIEEVIHEMWVDFVWERVDGGWTIESDTIE